jgi:hypothetical protein
VNKKSESSTPMGDGACNTALFVGISDSLGDCGIPDDSGMTYDNWNPPSTSKTLPVM